MKINMRHRKNSPDHTPPEGKTGNSAEGTGQTHWFNNIS